QVSFIFAVRYNQVRSALPFAEEAPGVRSVGLSAMTFASVLLLVFASPGRAAQEPDYEDLLRLAPANFSGAVGTYTISCRAEPTEVLVEDPLTLTVRITGSGPEKYLPKRLKLDQLAEDVEQDYFVEDVPEQDRRLPAENAWEFVYRLRPK